MSHGRELSIQELLTIGKEHFFWIGKNDIYHCVGCGCGLSDKCCLSHDEHIKQNHHQQPNENARCIKIIMTDVNSFEIKLKYDKIYSYGFDYK